MQGRSGMINARVTIKDNGLQQLGKSLSPYFWEGSSLQAIDKAGEEWGIEVNSRGVTAAPVVAAPVLHREPVNLNYYRMTRITPRTQRITQRTPRLCR